MNPAILTTIIQLCSNLTVENANGTWSSPKEAEIYRLECIEFYKDCGNVDLCMPKRLEYLKSKDKK